jgi:hypothetical protein
MRTQEFQRSHGVRLLPSQLRLSLFRRQRFWQNEQSVRSIYQTPPAATQNGRRAFAAESCPARAPSNQPAKVHSVGPFAHARAMHNNPADRPDAVCAVTFVFPPQLPEELFQIGEQGKLVHNALRKRPEAIGHLRRQISVPIYSE